MYRDVAERAADRSKSGAEITGFQPTIATRLMRAAIIGCALLLSLQSFRYMFQAF
jgi:hypothetical protein